MLAGKVTLISGASQGFGFEVARQFAINGAHVIICARDQALLAKRQKELEIIATDNARILSVTADISKSKQVKNLFDIINKNFGGLDVLVANAGVYGPPGKIETVDWKAWSDAIDINLKGTVLQCRYAIPLLKKRRSAKIIILSGGGATKPLPYLSAYAASKAAIVRFAETLAIELKETSIDVNTIAPGALNTRLIDQIIEAGPEKVGNTFYQQSLTQKQQGGTPLALGASLCVYLASSQSDGITGKLISAIWDPWKKLHEYKATLNETDIYTLRRIIPEDREQSWGSNS